MIRELFIYCNKLCVNKIIYCINIHPLDISWITSAHSTLMVNLPQKHNSDA